eukprot:1180804-Prorocentrum_minimum.AAC.2
MSMYEHLPGRHPSISLSQKVLVDVHGEINHAGFLQELDLCLKDLILGKCVLKLNELQKGEHQVSVQVAPDLRAHHPPRQDSST